MKTLRSLFFIAMLIAGACFVALPVVSITGCNTSQQTIAVNSLSAVESTATAAYNGYLTLVVQGKVRTNDVPTVSHAFNQLQADIVLAAVSLQNGTNALAPASITSEATNLVNVINSAELLTK